MANEGLSDGKPDGLLSTEYIKDNVLSLRRRLKLSQAEFIERFLTDENGKPMINVPKFSNFENRGGKDAPQYAQRIAAGISVDADIFFMDPDRFAKKINLFLEMQPCREHGEPSRTVGRVREGNHVEVLVRIISDYVFEGILGGEMHPGSKLPSDRSLSAMFGVGRTSIREALKVLSVLGMIDILPGQGTFIASDSSNFFIAPLSWTLLMGERNVGHVIDVRNVLEEESARLAAENAREEDRRRLTEIFGRSSKAYLEGNFQDFLDLDLDFHLAIAECSQNPIIQGLLLTTRKLIRYISKTGMVNLFQLGQIFDEHNLIYNAVRSGDSTAAMQAMNSHLAKSRDRYQINK